MAQASSLSLVLPLLWLSFVLAQLSLQDTEADENRLQFYFATLLMHCERAVKVFRQCGKLELCSNCVLVPRSSTQLLHDDRKCWEEAIIGATTWCEHVLCVDIA